LPFQVASEAGINDVLASHCRTEYASGKHIARKHKERLLSGGDRHVNQSGNRGLRRSPSRAVRSLTRAAVLNKAM